MGRSVARHDFLAGLALRREAYAQPARRHSTSGLASLLVVAVVLVARLFSQVHVSGSLLLMLLIVRWRFPVPPGWALTGLCPRRRRAVAPELGEKRTAAAIARPRSTSLQTAASRPFSVAPCRAAAGTTATSISNPSSGEPRRRAIPHRRRRGMKSMRRIRVRIRSGHLSRAPVGDTSRTSGARQAGGAEPVARRLPPSAAMR